MLRKAKGTHESQKALATVTIQEPKTTHLHEDHFTRRASAWPFLQANHQRQRVQMLSCFPERHIVEGCDGARGFDLRPCFGLTKEDGRSDGKARKTKYAVVYPPPKKYNQDEIICKGHKRMKEGARN
jgi:hypothetical protein